MNTDKHTTEDWIVANNNVDIHYADGSFVEVATACNEGFAKQIVHEHKEYASLLSENKKLREALERIAANTIIDADLCADIAKQALTIK